MEMDRNKILVSSSFASSSRSYFSSIFSLLPPLFLYSLFHRHLRSQSFHLLLLPLLLFFSCFFLSPVFFFPTSLLFLLLCFFHLRSHRAVPHQTQTPTISPLNQADDHSGEVSATGNPISPPLPPSTSHRTATLIRYIQNREPPHPLPPVPWAASSTGDHHHRQAEVVPPSPLHYADDHSGEVPTIGNPPKPHYLHLRASSPAPVHLHHRPPPLSSSIPCPTPPQVHRRLATISSGADLTDPPCLSSTPHGLNLGIAAITSVHHLLRALYPPSSGEPPLTSYSPSCSTVPTHPWPPSPDTLRPPLVPLHPRFLPRPHRLPPQV